MDRDLIKQHFRRALNAGLTEKMTYNSVRYTVQRLSKKADFSATLYGADSGYSMSVILEYAASLPGKGASVTIGEVSYIVLGREDLNGISTRLDLREGV